MNQKERKKRRKFLLSLLIVFVLGTTTLTGYAVATGRMPTVLNQIGSIFSSPVSKQPASPHPQNAQAASSSSEISPSDISQSVVISQPVSSKSSSSADQDAKIDERNTQTQTSGSEVTVQPIGITTSQSPASTSSAPVPKPNPPKKPIPSKPENPDPNPGPGQPDPANPQPPIITPEQPVNPSSGSGSSNHHQDRPITKVSLNKTEITLNKGNVSEPLTTSLEPGDTTDNKAITWTTNNDKIAKVDAQGRIAAVEAGSTQVVAHSCNQKTAVCNVKVLVPPASIKINSDDFSIDKDSSKTLTATVGPDDCTDKSVIWATSNNDIVSVDATGKVTAEKAGNATITASTADGKIKASCNVTVVISISTLKLDKTALTLIKGTEQTLTATIDPPDTTEEKKVIWTTSNPDVATVDDTGNIKGIENGTATITAQIGSHVAECKVTVTVPTTGITLDKTTVVLPKGKDDTLTATIYPQDTSDKAVEWSSSDESIATVDSSGKVTGIKVGSAVITAKTHNGGYTAHCTVNVVIPVTGITLDKTELNLIKGNSDTLLATIVPPDATDQTVTWESSDPAVATVDGTGKVTAAGGGSANIKVTTHDGKFTAVCKVTVTVPVSGISLDKTSLKLVKGTSGTLTATITPSDAGNKNVLWSTSNDDICSVDTSGKITGNNVGSAIITATSDDGGFTAQCTVTVVIPVTGVSLDKTSLSLVRLDTAGITATVIPGDATDQAITWESSNPAIATVDSTGKVTGVSVGMATIQAVTHDGGYKAQCSVTVLPRKYTVTANATNGTVTGAGTYTEGSSVTLSATPDAHYHFVNWTDQTGKVLCTNSTYIITGLNADSSVTANFAIDTFTVTASAGANGFVSGGGVYPYGTTVTLKATPTAHYHFMQWSDGITTPNRTITVSENISISAKFEIDTFTVSASGANGVVSGLGAYAYGSTVTLNAIPSDHYHFTGWSDGVTSASRTITVTGNVYFTAKFEIDTFTVNAIAGTGGTVSGGGTYPYGTAISLTATPNNWYAFSNWSDGSTAITRTYTVTGNVTLTANFRSTAITWSYILKPYTSEMGPNDSFSNDQLTETAEVNLWEIGGKGHDRGGDATFTFSRPVDNVDYVNIAYTEETGKHYQMNGSVKINGNDVFYNDITATNTVNITSPIQNISLSLWSDNSEWGNGWDGDCAYFVITMHTTTGKTFILNKTGTSIQ